MDPFLHESRHRKQYGVSFRARVAVDGHIRPHNPPRRSPRVGESEVYSINPIVVHAQSTRCLEERRRKLRLLQLKTLGEFVTNVVDLCIRVEVDVRFLIVHPSLGGHPRDNLDLISHFGSGVKASRTCFLRLGSGIDT